MRLTGEPSSAKRSSSFETRIFLRVRDQLEAVRVVAVEMREQYRVQIDRRDAPRCEPLVDGRAAFHNTLIREIQRQRAERADLRPAVKDAARAHVAMPAAVEQDVPVRALDEIGRNQQPEPFRLSIQHARRLERAVMLAAERQLRRNAHLADVENMSLDLAHRLPPVLKCHQIPLFSISAKRHLQPSETSRHVASKSPVYHGSATSPGRSV